MNIKTIILTAVITVVVIAGGFMILNAYIYEEKQGAGEIVEPYRATLTGEYVCLPHVDQTGPQTTECANGIKTDVGEYYAVDLNQMPELVTELKLGERFTANGVITPIERLSSDHWQKYPIVGIFSVTDSVVKENAEDGPYECYGDAMMCPDGSAVGRSGPKCEFTACPPANATSSRTTTYLGGTVTALNVSVTPKEIVSDSRCPSDVTCIWAGTVEVRTVLATMVGHGEHVLKLDEPRVFGDHLVTLVDVTPAKKLDAIPDSSYRFTFTIEKTKQELPITAKPAVTCYTGGCSGQLCSDRQDMVSTCEYREEYACYQTATCERQASGQCGWTETPSLLQCLSAGSR